MSQGYDMVKTHSEKRVVLSPKRSIHHEFIKRAFLCYGLWPFPSRPPHLPLSRKTCWTIKCNYYALKYVFWRPRPPRSLNHFCLGVNENDPEMSSTSNQRSYNTLERLPSPQCSPTLIGTKYSCEILKIQVQDLKSNS